MPKHGWKEHRATSAALADGGGRVLSYSNRKGNWCMITVSETAAGTAISVLHVRSFSARPGGRAPHRKETPK